MYCKECQKDGLTHSCNLCQTAYTPEINKKILKNFKWYKLSQLLTQQITMNDKIKEQEELVDRLHRKTNILFNKDCEIDYLKEYNKLLEMKLEEAVKISHYSLLLRDLNEVYMSKNKELENIVKVKFTKYTDPVSGKSIYAEFDSTFKVENKKHSHAGNLDEIRDACYEPQPQPIYDKAMFDNALKNIEGAAETIKNLYTKYYVRTESQDKKQPPKEKTLQNYCKEYFSMMPKEIETPLNHLSFEACCGLLKYICGEVDKEFCNCHEKRPVFICYNKNTQSYSADRFPNGYVNPFYTDDILATEKVIRICGTEFLDKIFKA